MEIALVITIIFVIILSICLKNVSVSNSELKGLVKNIFNDFKKVDSRIRSLNDRVRDVSEKDMDFRHKQNTVNTYMEPFDKYQKHHIDRIEKGIEELHFKIDSPPKFERAQKVTHEGVKMMVIRHSISLTGGLLTRNYELAPINKEDKVTYVVSEFCLMDEN